jgi:hypothetical protein
MDPVGSGQGPVAGSYEYGDEPSGSGAVELVRVGFVIMHICIKTHSTR